MPFSSIITFVVTYTVSYKYEILYVKKIITENIWKHINVYERGVVIIMVHLCYVEIYVKEI